MRDHSTISLRDLEDVIHGRDEAGRPFWSFHLSEQHFAGYGVSGVPAEFVHALGCGPDEKISVRIINASNRNANMTASWRLRSTTGAYLGNFRNHLEAIEASSGDLVRVTIDLEGVLIH